MVEPAKPELTKNEKMTFNIGRLYSGWAEQVELYFSDPFTVDEDGNFTPEQPQKPTPEEKERHVRNAQAHADMAAFDAAMVAIAGPDAELPPVKSS